MPAPDFRIPAWQLGIRFLLELGAWAAIGLYAASFGSGATRYIFCSGAILVVVVLWGTFAVKGDPSRSGRAPVPVPGVVRLALELLVFGAGAAALALLHAWIWLALFAAAFFVHHAGAGPRIKWLLATTSRSD